MKYIILGYSNPNIKTGKADVSVLCKNDFAIWWELTDRCNANNYWLFDTRKEADEYAELFKLNNCITYGIYV